MNEQYNDYHELFTKTVQQDLCPKYPHNEVVRYIFRNIHNKTLHLKDKVLDLGCGGGCHIIFLAENGFDTYGIDFNSASILQTLKKLKQKKLNANCSIASCTNIPYNDNYFNCVICYGSVYVT